MSEAEHPAAVPIRDGLEPQMDVPREALSYFKQSLAEWSEDDLMGVCFTLHHRNGTCFQFSYCAPDGLPNKWIEAQAAAKWTFVAGSEA